MGLALPDWRLIHPWALHPGRKPVGPVSINRSNPLSRDLRAAFLLRDLRDTAYGCMAENYNNGAIKTVNGYQTDGVNDLIKLSQPSQLCDAFNYSNMPPGGHTIALRVKSDSPGGNRSAFSIGGPGSELLYVYSASASATKATLYSTLKYESTGYGVYTTSADVFNGEWHTIVINFQSGGASGASFVYVDGVLDGSIAQSSVSAANTVTEYAALGSYIRGNNPNGANFIFAEFEFCCIWWRSLSAQEVAKFSRDPYQFLIPS